MVRHVRRLVVAVLMTAAAGLGLSPPAGAATCGTASGVSVVVDFHQLGDVRSACDAGGAGEYAAAQFADVGHTLTYVQGQPFVCQVDGAPSTQCVRTPPATAYWSLWWSDGKSGTWTYASLGVASLKVPDGGYVALSWQKGSAQTPPRVTPTSHASASPTSHPTSKPPSSPTSAPSPSSGGGPGGATSTPPGPASSASSSPATRTSPTTSGPSRSASKPPARASATPQASRSAVPAGTGAAAPPDTSAPSSGSGLPGWVAPVLVGALFVAAGAVAVVRRKRAGGA
jgi:hypothetical protein